ncbi:structure-specific recognition protein 1 [Tieghemostelium lacteum]|uniref:FACT complex subunit SSRP1 n=1 Tax=Tieghemostelium lacteum TaxID=361077 RepID=A0A151ZIG3_TIELA|nr:structure-specific recognition protein 1 [Tieghemostelium lacteum]|eukprot:KYQ93791.1 structure-specific recognition protein 1 [Tieghemostelium lacteum]
MASTTVAPTGPQFNNITVGGKIGSVRGILKLTTTQITWKPDIGKAENVNPNDLESVSWIRITPKVFQISLLLRNGIVVKYDGFRESDLDLLKKFFESVRFDIQTVDLSTKGNNFGELIVGNTMITFMHEEKVVFEFPTSEVTQTSINQKNELTLEFQRPSNAEVEDETLVEIRFFTPNRHAEGETTGGSTVSETAKPKESKKSKDKEGDQEMKDQEEEESDGGESDEEEEKLTIVELMQQQIKDKSDVSSVGKSLVVLSNIQFLTPRGRIDIEMYASFLKLHGKTHDYKVNYTSISKLFIFEHQDRLVNFVISLDPPVRQGKTKYSHLVIQFPLEDEEISLDLNLTEELKEKFSSLPESIQGKRTQILANLLKIMTNGKRITPPGSFKGHDGAFNSVKCSLKANEGYLHPLEKSFFFLNKPPTYISYDEIVSVEFTRVSMAMGGANSRTFDMSLSLKSNTSIQFTSIPKAEYNVLYSFLKERKLQIETPDTTVNPAMLIDDDSDDSDYVSGEEESEPESDSSDPDDVDSEEEKKSKKKHKSK